MLPAAAAGEMAARVRDFDWSATALGPIADWPPALRTAVDICLNSPIAMFVWWGPDLINIYNDAYAPTLGTRHPAALGMSGRSIWAEVWSDVQGDVERVVLQGESVSRKRVRFVLERNGYPEEAFVSYAFSPIPDGRGGIGGMFQVCRDETAQVLAERERDRLADRPREILESITDAFFSVDREWRFTYLNAAAERLLQRPPGSLLGRNLWEEFPAAVGTTFDREYHRAIAEHVPVAFEAYYPPPLDTWYQVRGYPAADGLSVYFQDVTGRRQIEEKLRTSEERLALAVGAADIGTFYCPLPLGRIEWNDACKAHFWLPPDADVDIDLFYARIHPDDRDRTRAAVERAVAGGDPYDIEYRVVAPDGRQRWVRALGRAYHDAAGVPVRFDGVTLDVTDRRLAADALRESERRFREMADAAPAMLWVTEPDGHCSFLSRGWYAFTGQTEAEGLGYGWADAAHPDDGPAARDAFVAAGAARREYASDYRLRRADGAYRWVIDAGRPRFGPGGEFLGYIGSVIDIHDRKLAEDERNRLLDSERAARAEAERVSRLKDEFLATLSHELRTPLNAILGWSQILRDGPADPRQGLEVIERNARAQKRIIEDLLDMSRIVAGKIRLDVQPVALAPVIEAAVETVRPAADAKGVRLQVVLDPLAGPVSGDPSRLQQAFWNLLSNSVKHTNRGGRVQVTLARVDSHLEVGVADDGEGISPDFLPHAFERFRQADGTTTRRHGGLGLGLSIVKQLVELHGGTVAAASPGVGRGATFTVALPLSAVQPDPGASVAAAASDGGRRHPRSDAGQSVAPSPTTDAGALAGVRVVVVDDEADARELVRRILAQGGATVATVGSSADALEAVRRDRPDVLVSDLGMPDEDGYGLIRRIRALPAADGGDVPAVALTAYARSEDRTRALLAGFTGHIAKPVEPAELTATIVALARRRAT